MKARLVFAHALSPLHAGTGQGVGVIDLPIAREKATGLPYLPGSSLKGVLRDACGDQKLRNNIFGSDPASNEYYASSAAFTDLRLLLLPVRSVSGTFAWVTSPYILLRLLRDLESIGASGPGAAVPEPKNDGAAVSYEDCAIIQRNKVLLEDLDLDVEKDSNAAKWGKWLANQIFSDDETWQKLLMQRLCVVSGDVLGFLLDTSTEVFARIRLQEDSKTVQKGGLWYEEALPTETVLSGIVAASFVRTAPEEVFKTLGKLVGRPLQLGGKATVGAGLCRVLLSGGV